MDQATDKKLSHMEMKNHIFSTNCLYVKSEKKGNQFIL